MDLGSLPGKWCQRPDTDGENNQSLFSVGSAGEIGMSIPVQRW